MKFTSPMDGKEVDTSQFFKAFCPICGAINWREGVHYMFCPKFKRKRKRAITQLAKR